MNTSFGLNDGGAAHCWSEALEKGHLGVSKRCPMVGSRRPSLISLSLHAGPALPGASMQYLCACFLSNN